MLLLISLVKSCFPKLTNIICYQLFINNEFVEAKSGNRFEVINPSNGDIICDVAEADKVLFSVLEEPNSSYLDVEMSPLCLISLSPGWCWSCCGCCPICLWDRQPMEDDGCEQERTPALQTSRCYWAWYWLHLGMLPPPTLALFLLYVDSFQFSGIELQMWKFVISRSPATCPENLAVRSSYTPLH